MRPRSLRPGALYWLPQGDRQTVDWSVRRGTGHARRTSPVVRVESSCSVAAEPRAAVRRQLRDQRLPPKCRARRDSPSGPAAPASSSYRRLHSSTALTNSHALLAVKPIVR